MKLRARIPYFKMISTILALQLVAVAFVHFREQFILHMSQVFTGLTFFVMIYLLFAQRQNVWQGQPVIARAIGPKQSRLLSLDCFGPMALAKTAGLFLFFLLFIWQVNYLSLYQMQPLMYSDMGLPIRYDISPGDLLGFTLRLALQTWVLALALALVFNRLPKNGEFGFIRGQYQKLSTFVWYISNMAGAGVNIVLLFALGLLTLDIGKFMAKSAGSDVMNVPQFDLVVLLFSFYLFNIATGFTKRLKQWGDQAQTSVVFVVSVQLAFVLFVYGMVRVMLVYLPEETVYALMQPFYFDFLDNTKFPAYWQLFATAMSIFMVPLLAHYFYHACRGEKVLKSVTRLLIIPAGLCLALLGALPMAKSAFWTWIPTVNMFSVELNNVTSRYEISWVSYFSVLILVCLMLMLKRSSNLTLALVDVMPEQVGRRVRRVKAFYARAYPFLISLLSLYLLAGVVVGLYFSSLFLIATWLGLGLCFVAGLKYQEA